MDDELRTLAWIAGSGLLMALIALVGSLTLTWPEARLRRWLKPLIALAAGSLLGGAFFHMIPHALAGGSSPDVVLLWVCVGFTVFLALDLVLDWHHCRRSPGEGVRPLAWLLLLADGLHNLLGGLAVGAVFTVDIRAGIVAWVAAALHEVPQELGDFGALVHSGMPARRALRWNLLSAMTFPLGGVVAWALGQGIDVGFLVALGAGNFLYIAAADLVPELKRTPRLGDTATRLASYLAGVALLYVVRRLFEG